MTQKKKPASKPAPRARVVYEVKGPQGTRQVDATTTAELKTALTSLLGLEPYSVQAAAHLAHTERATVQGSGWSIKRLGILKFEQDPDPVAPRRGPQKARQSQEAGETLPSSTVDAQPQHLPQLLHVSEDN